MDIEFERAAEGSGGSVVTNLKFVTTPDDYSVAGRLTVLVASLPHDHQHALVDRSNLSGSVTVSASPWPQLKIEEIDQPTTNRLGIAAVIIGAVLAAKFLP